jgi:hypothetical protein
MSPNNPKKPSADDTNPGIDSDLGEEHREPEKMPSRSRPGEIEEEDISPASNVADDDILEEDEIEDDEDEFEEPTRRP